MPQEYIPPAADHDWVRGVFTQFGNITYVSLPRYRTSGDMKGFAFVEFETVGGAAKACEVTSVKAYYTDRNFHSKNGKDRNPQN